MRRGWWHWLGVIVMVVGAVAAPAQAASEVEILLNKLVQKGLLTQTEADDVRREVTETKEVRTKELAKEIVPEWTKRFNWSGDVRLRHESFWRDGSSDRHRERVRLRFGFKGAVSDQVEAGVRLATGANLDPISTNQSAQDIFDKKDLLIDHAYLKFTTKGTAMEGLPLTVWGGKFDNPFSYTSLAWDGDLTPEGLAASVAPAWGPFEAAVTGGLFVIDELGANAEDPLLFGSQGGVTWSVAPEAEAEWLKRLKIKAALAYYDYKNLKTGIDTTSSNRFGNTARSESSASTTILRHDVNEVDLLGEIRSQVLGRPLLLYADYIKNTAVAKADEGIQIGVKLGKADKPLAWEAGYFWQRLDADAVVGQFTDSDFGEGGTGRDGHVFQAALGTLKNSTLGFKWGLTESISTPDRGIDRVQVDWVTKF